MPERGSVDRWRRLLAFVFVAAGATVGLLPDAASAHSLDTVGYSEVTQQGEDVLYELLVDYAAFATVAGIGEPGGGRSAAPDEELRRHAAEAAEYLDPRLQVLVDGMACDGSLTDTGVESRFEQPYARLSLRYDCPGAGEYEIRYSVLVGDIDAGHSNVAKYDLADRTGRFLFDAEHQELSLGETSLPRQAYRFAALGFSHILDGLDHVLFVVVLLIGASSLREVMAVVTTFTVAHTTTLVLTATGAISVPSSVVEPLIALSIAYVAADSLLGRPASRYRLAAVFGFGLLHGMGFAGALWLTGDPDWSSISSLAGFNIGIELGQALVVAVLFPLLLLIRRFTWSQYAQLGTTGLIAFVGLVWFAQRLIPT